MDAIISSTQTLPACECSWKIDNEVSDENRVEKEMKMVFFPTKKEIKLKHENNIFNCSENCKRIKLKNG